MKKSRWKRISLALLSLIMFFAVFLYFPKKETYVKASNTADDMVSIAKNEIGNTYYKYTSALWSIDGSYAYSWCAAFTSYCAKYAGVSGIKQTTGCLDQYNNSSGTKHWVVSDKSYVPQSGDLVFYDWNSTGSRSANFDHVEVVEYFDNSSRTIHTIAGNSGDGSTTTRKVCRRTRSYDSTVKCFLTPNYSGYVTPTLNNDTPLGIPYPRPTGTPLIQYGSTGSYVCWVQSALNKVGYSLTVDGDFGANTDSAVRSFQSKYGLEVDGQVGSATIAKLVSVITGETSSIVTPTISTNKDSYTVGDTVYISWTASPSNSNLSHYWLQISAPDGTRILNETMNKNTSYSFTVSQSGTYQIIAWSTPQGSISGEGSLTDTVNISVAAKKINHMVYFNANGGNCSVSSKSVTEGETYGSLPDVTKSGYSFNGWYTLNGNKITSTSTVNITSDTTLYAHLTAKQYTLYFNTTGGTCSESKKIITYNDTYGSLPIPTRNNSIFKGWYDERLNRIVTASDQFQHTETDSFTLVAKWETVNEDIYIDIDQIELTESELEKNNYQAFVSVFAKGKDDINMPAVNAIEFGIEFDPRCTVEYKYGQILIKYTINTIDMACSINNNKCWMRWASDKATKIKNEGTLLGWFMVNIPTDAKAGDIFKIKYMPQADNSVHLWEDTESLMTYSSSWQDGYIKIISSPETTTTSKSTTTTTTTTVPDLSIDTNQLTLKNGEQYTISANQGNLTYKSNNPDIAIVSKKGIITAIGEGTAIISVINQEADVVQIHVSVIPAQMIGDTNEDNSVTTADIIMMEKYLHAKVKFTKQQKENADMNHDGKVNIYDYILLKKKLIRK